MHFECSPVFEKKEVLLLLHAGGFRVPARFFAASLSCDSMRLVEDVCR